MKSYVTARNQYLQIENAQSCLSNITTGIPQGSILGPLLFIIYVNDITSASDLLKFIINADNTTLLSTITHVIDERSGLNDELKKISD